MGDITPINTIKLANLLDVAKQLADLKNRG